MMKMQLDWILVRRWNL